MRAVSINREQTVDEHRVALNFDEELTPEMRQMLEYGSLAFSGEGHVLVVHIDNDDQDLLDRGTVEEIESKLSGIMQRLGERDRKRERMLAYMKERTGLPIA